VPKLGSALIVIAAALQQCGQQLADSQVLCCIARVANTVVYLTLFMSHGPTANLCRDFHRTEMPQLYRMVLTIQR
jgi:hypothetical protein